MERLRLFARSMRIHYWAKNLLICFPAIAGHHIEAFLNPGLLVGAFFSFSTVASGIYLMNDIFDVSTDVLHPIKARRPIAAGLLSAKSAVVGALVLIGIGLGLAVALQTWLTVWILVYIASNVAYSMWVKRVLILDFLFMVGFHLIRVFAGAALFDIHLSYWIITFFIAFFSGAVFLKKTAALQSRTQGNQEGAFGLRAGSVLCGLVCLAISIAYIFSPAATILYINPSWLWLPLCCFAIWTYAIWRKVQTGKVKDDLILLVLLHPGCYATLLLFVGVVLWTGK
jgi:4-hydroxybenzoate polyprenyltransferase